MRHGIAHLGTAALGVALPAIFLWSAMDAAPILGRWCIRWTWPIPGFTALVFLAAALLVGAGMLLHGWSRRRRQLRWAHEVARLGSIPWCEPASFGPARPLIVEALALRFNLATSCPLTSDHLRHIGDWMDALCASCPVADQVLRSAGIEATEVARSLRTVLGDERSGAQTAVEVLRVIHGFLGSLTSAGTAGYRV